MKDEFIATVSHELRTPVTTMAGPLGLLANGAVGEMPEKAKRLIAMAHNNCVRLTRLVNDILDFEKIEAGMMTFNSERSMLKALSGGRSKAILRWPSNLACQCALMEMTPMLSLIPIPIV